MEKMAEKIEVQVMKGRLLTEVLGMILERPDVRKVDQIHDDVFIHLKSNYTIRLSVTCGEEEI